MWSPSPLQRRATSALDARLRELLPRAPQPLLDSSGYVRDLRDNLLPHLTGEDATWIREQLEQGDGDELSPRTGGRRPKAHAAHSSAALAANTFAPFRGREHDLTIAGLSGFTGLRLEAKHHPLPAPDPPVSDEDDDRRAANLDAELKGPGVVVGVEAKLTEHLAATDRVTWSWKYRRTAVLEPLPEPWREAMRRRTTGAMAPGFLNAAQLLKHGLALCRSAADGAFGPDPVDLHLVYLYWEPANGDEIDPVLEHREEVGAFAAEVAGSVKTTDDTRVAGVTFHALTHRELWKTWQTDDGGPRWSHQHANALAERYDVEVTP